MRRGNFTPAGVDQEHVHFYVDLFARARARARARSKVREAPEWQDFMGKGAFNTTFMTGDESKGVVG